MSTKRTVLTILIGDLLLAAIALAGWWQADSQQRLVLALRADLGQARTELSQQQAKTGLAEQEANWRRVDLSYARRTIETLSRQLAALPEQVRSCYQGMWVQPMGKSLIRLPVEVCGWNVTWAQPSLPQE